MRKASGLGSCGFTGMVSPHASSVSPSTTEHRSKLHRRAGRERMRRRGFQRLGGPRPLQSEMLQELTKALKHLKLQPHIGTLTLGPKPVLFFFIAPFPSARRSPKCQSGGGTSTGVTLSAPPNIQLTVEQHPKPV